MTRVLVISEKFYPEGGGAEVVTYEIVRWLLSRGHDVVILTGTSATNEILQDLRRLASASQAEFKYVYTVVLRPGKKIWYWFFAPILLRKIVNVLKSVDIVYIPGILYTLIPWLRKVRKDIHIVVHLHNFQPLTYSQFFVDVNDSRAIIWLDLKLSSTEYGSRSYVLTPMIPLSLRIIQTCLLYADKIIVPTYSCRYRIEKYLPHLAKKMVVIYNPIFENNIHRLHDILASKGRIVVYLGGKGYVKGAKLALTISKYITRKLKNVRVFLVGFSDSLVVHHENSSKLIMLPRVSRNLAKRIIEKGRVLLFPSIVMEPCPNVILESLSLGTVPVAFTFDTIRELISATKVERYLCEPYDVNCLIERIKEVLSLDYASYRDIVTDVLVKLNQRLNKRYLLEQFEHEICNY